MAESNEQITPKKKDLWDKLPIITTFLGTTVIGALSLALTQSFQRLESNRQDKFQSAQIATQKSQIRIEELKAITSLAPLLASKDPKTRAIGTQLLRAVSESNFPYVMPESSHLSTDKRIIPRATTPTENSQNDSTAKTRQLSLIDIFAQIALASNEPSSRRLEATKEIGKIADGLTTPLEVKERAVDAATTIALSSSAPDEVRNTASDIVANIKSVSPELFAAFIAKEPVTRDIREVILHHTTEPSIASYSGPKSIFSMAKSQMKIRNWSKISWHYAVSPDGMIWLGMPVNVQTSHAVNRNFDSVSVLIVINGDKEIPTEPQKRALGVLLSSLLEKFQLTAEGNFTDQKGFHRNYYGKTCPGNNITKELVFDCLKLAKISIETERYSGMVRSTQE